MTDLTIIITGTVKKRETGPNSDTRKIIVIKITTGETFKTNFDHTIGHTTKLVICCKEI